MSGRSAANIRIQGILSFVAEQASRKSTGKTVRFLQLRTVSEHISAQQGGDDYTSSIGILAVNRKPFIILARVIQTLVQQCM
jgi:hypothetical protein